jgi:hypothetical protein
MARGGDGLPKLKFHLGWAGEPPLKRDISRPASSYQTFIFNVGMAEPVDRHFLFFMFNLIFNGGRADYSLDKYAWNGLTAASGLARLQGGRTAAVIYPFLPLAVPQHAWSIIQIEKVQYPWNNQKLNM